MQMKQLNNRCHAHQISPRATLQGAATWRIWWHDSAATTSLFWKFCDVFFHKPNEDTFTNIVIKKQIQESNKQTNKQTANQYIAREIKERDEIREKTRNFVETIREIYTIFQNSWRISNEILWLHSVHCRNTTASRSASNICTVGGGFPNVWHFGIGWNWWPIF